MKPISKFGQKLFFLGFVFKGISLYFEFVFFFNILQGFLCNIERNIEFLTKSYLKGFLGIFDFRIYDEKLFFLGFVDKGHKTRKKNQKNEIRKRKGKKN